MIKINWNEISELGLLERINDEIMHPLGLAVFRTADDGSSGGALVAEDRVWEYADRAKLKNLTIEQVKERLEVMIAKKEQEPPADV